MEAESELVKASWAPQFRFMQSSPHSGVTNVNGESEVVHWVVKDRPFSLRVLEVPSAVGEQVPEANLSDLTSESELSWTEVEVEADVVYTRTHLPVKPSTGHSPMSLERSVIPPNIYNHRRNANLLDQQSGHGTGAGPRVLKLKEGAGLELLVRLSILTSHLRNDFCIQLKLYIRQHLVAVWYSETIKSVSKWDKVTQKPVSSDIARADPADALAMQEDDDDGASSSTSVSQPAPSFSSRAVSSTRFAFSGLEKDDRATHYPKNGKKKKASGEEVFEMLQQLRSNVSQLQEMSASPAALFNKKRKATWEPSPNAYPTEQEVAMQVQRTLSKPFQSRSKKFKLSEPSSSPHELSLADSHHSTSTVVDFANYAQEFLRQLDTMPLSEVRSALSSVLLTRPDLAASLSRLMKFNEKNQSHQPSPRVKVETGVDSNVTVAPTASTLARSTCLASSASNEWQGFTTDLVSNEWPAESMGLAGAHAATTIGTSGYWNDERYGLTSTAMLAVSTTVDATHASMAAPSISSTTGPAMELDITDDVNPAVSSDPACVYDNPSIVLSPSAFDDDSTTMGSPTSYSSWGDEWQPTEHSETTLESTPFHQPFQLLTDSSLFSGLETAGF